MFGVVWEASIVLAHLMLDIDIQGRRFLEVGCGIGLPSLVLSRRQANVTATDRHPCAESFLVQNAALNSDNEIPFVRAAWADAGSELGRFDVIIGSDLLYEPDQVGQLSSFIGRHGMPDSTVIIVDPGRFLHSRFSHGMEKLGYSCHKSKPALTGQLGGAFKGMVLSYRRGRRA